MAFGNRTVLVSFSVIILLIGVIGCSKSSNPVAPTQDPVMSLPRTAIYSDSFEVAPLTSRYVNFYGMVGGSPLPLLSLTSLASHGGTHSVTADSNNTAIQKVFYTIMDSGVIGLEFYMMASSSAHCGFTASLGRTLSSSMGRRCYFGMGFDQSNSVKYVHYSNSVDTAENSVTITSVQANKWYKCTIEFDFSTTTASFYLDGIKKGTQSFSFVGYLDMVALYRDENGTQGQQPCYFDDLLVYRR